jgi:excisionase family DNA binding protein
MLGGVMSPDAPRRARRPSQVTAPLFVRLPVGEAERLDRAAEALGTTKRQLVGALVARHVDPTTAAGLDRLRRVVIETGGEELTVGRHAFRPLEPPEVLTLAQVAELLGVEEAAAAELAERGELPGRRIGDEWRFARSAVLAWLGGGDPG